MPLLAAFFGSVIGKLAEILGVWLSKKAAVSLSVISTITAATAALWVALSALVASLPSAPALPGVQLGLYFINVPALLAFISVCAATELAVSGYRYQRFVVDQLNR